ncbi:MAG: ABC transporter ATP-binding protein [Phycisphaerales bacterium]|nr:ABC transporter ATP-binding protein [Phycisphaerales bacterium]
MTSATARTPSDFGCEHSSSSPLSIHALTVAYDRRPVLWDVDLDVPAQSIVGVIGPNGAGKSTLLKACLGLIPIASGKVSVFGKPYEEQRARVGYVPQRESVDWDFPVSVLEVVMMGTFGQLGWFQMAGKLERAKAREALDAVGLADEENQQIGQLSGGQQQRVFLARALAQSAQIYLMDEPFSSVDAATEQAIIAVLRRMRSEGRTVIVVHHDLETARDYFDWVILLNTRVVAAGPTATTLTHEQLRKTYGGRLTLLDEAAQRMQKAQLG